MFGLGTPKVSIYHYVPPADLRWGTDGVLVEVKDGEGALKWTAMPAAADQTRLGLTLRGVPLLYAHSADGDWYFETGKLLSQGWGRSSVAPAAVADLRAATGTDTTSWEATIRALTPVLGLLKSGLYLVSWAEHCPTNGAGESFWSVGEQPRYAEAASWGYYFWSASDADQPQWPAFLTPTERFENLNPVQIDHYRRLSRQGVPLRALALHYDFTLSVLLDGHHRATAALLEGKPLWCLTIASAQLAGGNSGQRVADWRNPPRGLRSWLRSFVGRKREPSHVPAAEPTISVPPATARHEEIRAAATEAARRYLTCADLALVARIGDITDERIAQMFVPRWRRDDEISLVMRGLMVRADSRALAVAIRILRTHDDSYERSLALEPALRFLSNTFTEDVLEAHLALVVADDRSRPALSAMVDRYLHAYDRHIRGAGLRAE